MILLTGGTGFVGGNLIDELLKRGYRVRCLVRDLVRARSLEQKGCEIVRGDIRDRGSILEAIDQEIDTAIHLVGILTETRRVSFEDVHTEGTRNVVDACREKGVRRYIHVSALGTRKDARSRYHKTKWAAEEIVRGSGLAYTIFRPSVIFGREDNFTNLFARIMKLSPFIMIPGDGTNRMQPVFIKDLVKMMARSIEMEGAVGKTYEVGGPEKYTFDEIIERIATVLRRRVVRIHIPLAIMRGGAMVAETLLPTPPITRDQLLMLEEDNVTDDNSIEEVFGIRPAIFEEAMRTYLS